MTISNKIILVAIVSFAVFHFCTLSISPLPWYDETSFASGTVNLLRNGTYFLEVKPPFYPGNNISCTLQKGLMYGPVYFFLTRISFKLLGYSIFSFRIVTLLSGLILVLLFYKLLENKKQNIILFSAFSLTVLFATDPFFNSAMHQGRMDLTSLVFAFASVLILRKYSTSENKKTISIASGLMASLAILTTIRAVVAVAPVAVMWFYIFPKHKYAKSTFACLALWILAAAIPMFAWIFYAFGSFENWIDFYITIKKNEEIDYVGSRLNLPVQLYPVFIASFFIFVYGFYLKKIKLFDSVISVSIVAFLLFYFLVNNQGPHIISIVPFVYLLLALITQKISNEANKKIISATQLVLIVFNAGIFLIKGIEISVSAGERNPSVADEFIRRNIPKGSKVIGDEIYYYSVLKNKSEYQYSYHYGTDSIRESYHRNNYDYDYLIMSNRLDNRQPQITEIYKTNAILIPVDTLTTSVSPVAEIISKYSPYDISKNGYSGIIYKRVK